MRSGTSSCSLKSSSFGDVGLRLALLSTTLIAGGLPLAAHAQSTAPSASAQAAQVNFNVPPQALDSALTSVADQGGIRIFFTSAEVAGVRSNGVSGAMSVEAALSQALTGTGFTWRAGADGTFRIEGVPAASGEAINLGPVRVEGQSGSGATSYVAPPTAEIGNLPEAYAGGQVARGSKLGILGNRDYMDTPYSTSSFTEQTIRDSQARTVTDILALDPIVQLATGSTSEGGDFFYVRGFQGNSTGGLVEGLPGLLDRRNVPIEGFERVEFLRGPNAVLNGRTGFNNTSGTLNLIPKRATAETLTRLNLRYRADSNLGAHFDVGRRFGSNGSFGIRVNAVYEDGELVKNDVEQKRLILTTGLDYQVDRLRLSADLFYTDLDSNPQTRELSNRAAGVGIPAPPDFRTRLENLWEFWRTNALSGKVRAEYDFSNTVTGFATYGRARADEELLISLPQVISNNGDVRQRFLYIVNRQENYAGEAGLRANINTGSLKHELVAVGSINRIKFVAPVFTAPELGNTFNLTNIYRPTYIEQRPTIPDVRFGDASESSSYQRALTIADTVSTPDNRWQLTLGARLQQIETPSYNESALTPTVALVFRPNTWLSLYGSYIEGLQQGPTAPSDTLNANEIFPPIKTTQYEAGGKLDFASIGGTLSVFSITQPSYFRNNDNLFASDGSQRNRGIELSLFGTIGKTVRFFGGANYLDARLLRTAGGLFDGNTPQGLSRFQGKMSVEHDLAVVPGLTLVARGIHTGRQFVDRENTLTVPSWTTFDLGARYATEIGRTPVTFFLEIDNVSDERYYSSGFLLVGQSRSISFTISTDF